jgi:hypothetical protein
MTLPVVQCGSCVHFDRANMAGNFCDAFPDGIPEEITRNEFDHRNPHPDDNGIRYTPLPRFHPQT